MGQFVEIFKKVNGMHVLSQYRKGHVLFHALLATALEGTSRKSLEIVRLSVENKLLKKLRRQYRDVILDFQSRNPTAPEGENPPVIWYCWLQGMESAPEIVKLCYESLKGIDGYELRLLTKENLPTLIELPDYILEKHEQGIISNAHFADLVRLQLLIQYGGTWIDSTVFCSSKQVPDYLMNADLFVYRTLKPGLDGHSTSISNWFITARQGSRILRLTRDLLYEYWKKHDDVIDYYIFHYFFELAMEAFPEDANRIPPASNEAPHMLLLRLFEPYDEEIYRAILSQTCFHKLSYKFSKDEAERENTYFRHLIEKGQ